MLDPLIFLPLDVKLSIFDPTVKHERTYLEHISE